MTPELDFTMSAVDEYIEKIKFNPEHFKQPILDRAGIVNLNPYFESLPPELIDAIGMFPDIDYQVLDYLIYFLSNKVNTDNQSWLQEKLSYPQHLNQMYKITPSGLIDQIASLKLFDRLFGVAQLGPRLDFPVANTHSRAVHSISTTIDMLRILQVLSDKSSEILELRLRKDFENEKFYDPEMSREAIFNLATDICTFTGMLHDIATPAGGDAIKYFAHLDEEVDIEYLLFGSDSNLQLQRDELFAICKQRGLGIDHLKFIVNCIQGKSVSLIGDMIHPTKGDLLDQDRAAYTKGDAKSTSVLWHEIPKKLIPAKLPPKTIEILEACLNSIVETCSNEAVCANSGVPIQYPSGKIYLGPRPSVSFIDPTDFYFLDKELRLVNSKPEILSWIAAFRTLVTVNYYIGYKLLGIESELQGLLGTLSPEVIGDLFSKENLLGMTDEQLYSKIKQLGNKDLGYFVHSLRNRFNSCSYSGEIVDSDEDSPGSTSCALAKFTIKFKPGLDSLILDDGQIMTLKDYLLHHPDDRSTVLINTGLKSKGRQIVIRKVRSDQAA